MNNYLTSSAKRNRGARHALNCNRVSLENQQSHHATVLEPRPQNDGIELREYQKRVIGQVYGLIRAGVRSIVLIAVMGAGKTVVSAWIMRDAVGKGRRVVFLVSLTVLLDQTAATLTSLGVHCTVLQANRPVDSAAPVIVASLQTIAARVRKGQTVENLLGLVDLVIVDEAHIAAYNAAYALVEAAYPTAIKLGLTATPWRLSREEWLGQKFASKVEGPQPPEIVAMGGAVPCRVFTLTGVLNLDEIHVRQGDFVEAEMAGQACRPEALQHVFREHQRLCPDRPTLMIGSTVFQALATAETFNRAGVRAEVIVGSTPTAERQAIFERVKQGETQIICSVGCLTAGFDLPAISAILYVRATKSRALFLQSAGRGSRPYPGKPDYILLDFGGNAKRFGNPMGTQDYSIDHWDRKKPRLRQRLAQSAGLSLAVKLKKTPKI